MNTDWTRSVIHDGQQGILVTVRVQPGASRDAIVGVRDGVLQLRIQAPPHEGAANERLRSYLAKTLHIAKGRICIVNGQRGRQKTLFLAGLCPSDLQQSLSSSAPAAG